MNSFARTRVIAQAALAVALLGTHGCGGGGDDPPPPLPVPDLAGVWAGTWEGSDPALGRVGGTWEAVFSQSATQLSGPLTLLGDVDCMSGQAQGALDAFNHLSGTADRSPCPLNQWTLTALSSTAFTATGAWSQTQTGAQGSLSGQRIAVAGGPRVLSLHPPAGAPGTLITISGQSLATPASSQPLVFDQTAQPALQATSATRWVARVPVGASTGPVRVRTTTGEALGPVMFRTEVASPTPSLSWSLATTASPNALATSRDGRKLFVTERSGANGAVTVIHTIAQRQLTRTALANAVPLSIAASPDGRWLYVLAAGRGVLVMDGALATLVDTLPMTVSEAGFDNPQGIALSPDGALLLVSEGAPGGAATLRRTADKTVVASLALPAGSVPLGVGFSADGGTAHVLAADPAGGPGALLSFDASTGAAVRAPIAVGARPTGIAASPDGSSLFVSNQADNTVSRIDLAAGAVSATVPVGLAPAGLAFSADGTRVFVANRDGQSVSVLLAANGLPAATPVPLGGSPLSVAMDPQGLSAFVARSSDNAVSEIGGARTLNVLIGGTGYGSVTSSPSGIRCGTSCLARFAAGTVVTLAAAPDSGSDFLSWSGDAACAAGVVTLNANTVCMANFASKTPPPSPPPPGGGCFIATAAYGSAMAPEVATLRRFRDRHLMTNAPGRAFVAFYYRHSPALADAIAPHDAARATVRAALWPVVFAVKEPLAALLLALAAGAGRFAWRRTQRRPRAV